MKNRLLQLLTNENMTALKFAEIMEIRPSNVSHILSGRNNPNFDFIARLLRRFPELNPDWVLNGVGEMYRADFKHNFSAMGDEGAVGDVSANVVARLFLDDEIAATVAEKADPVQLTPDISTTVQKLELPALHLNSSNTGDPEPQAQRPAPQIAEDGTGSVAEKTAPEPQKLVAIYTDNTFEILTLRSR